MIATVRLGLNGTGSALAYNVPSDTPAGALVVLPPLPWMDGNAVGVVSGPSDYSGDVRSIVRVLDHDEVEELRRAHEAERAYYEQYKAEHRCTGITKAGTQCSFSGYSIGDGPVRCDRHRQ